MFNVVSKSLDSISIDFLVNKETPKPISYSQSAEAGLTIKKRYKKNSFKIHFYGPNGKFGGVKEIDPT